MTQSEEVWIPLVDEPIGSIVERIQAEHADIGALIDTPQRLLAFRTFAYIRVGVVLGELLVENDIEPHNGSGTWIDALLSHPEVEERVVDEVRAVAEEVANDVPKDAALGPDDAARERFLAFARRQLDQS
ncbi:MAG TPA: hypothetical protein VKD88_07490 [Gaiellaceae bacterium]|nr:hypothetical protein [Gaiellaceae bacterium]